MRKTWDEIYDMRQKGATLQEIGDEVGRTRERIRQILEEHYGGTKIKSGISTGELCKQTDCSYSTITNLMKKGLISPIRQGYLGRPYLWDFKTVSMVRKLTARHCEVCGKSIKSGKRCKEHIKVKLNCSECGEEFELSYRIFNARRKRGYKHFFCSRKCFGKYNTRHPPARKYNYEEIYSLVEKGYRLTEISRELGIPIASVHGILKRGGYKHGKKKLEFGQC